RTGRSETESCDKAPAPGILAAVKLTAHGVLKHEGSGVTAREKEEGVRATTARGVGAVGRPDPKAVPGLRLHDARLSEAPGRVRGDGAGYLVDGSRLSLGRPGD